MVEVILANSAWEDLDSTTDYIARDSLRYAEEFSNGIFEYIEQLKTFPESGRMVPEFQNPELRELVHGNYRIVYRIYEPMKIVVLRIMHGSKPLA